LLEEENMRNAYRFIPAGVLLGLVAGLQIGCWSTYDDYYLPLTDPKLASDGGLPSDCAGDPTKDAALVRDECGVFTSAGAAAGGNGTKAHPFATLAEAVTEAQSSGKRVYACAPSAKGFSEAVTIAASIEVFGGFNCANWGWSKAERTALDGPADKVALTFANGANGAKVVGFAVTAASPSDMKSGGSSVAVAVADVDVTLEGCDLKASDAADGKDGQPPTGLATKGADAPKLPADGGPTDACTLEAGVAGGMGGATTCDDGDTAGGKGGGGGITSANSGYGVSGGDGTPAGNVNHGVGADATNDCIDGTKGENGDAGGVSPGGSAAGDAISLSGISNNDNTDGKAGTKAQGGGGGGGARSGTFCKPASSVVDGPGASGGGAGAGGCGGKGGSGGKAGGSSIAILSLGTKLVLNGVTLAVGKAGNGGSGAIGQGGASGGHGADGGSASGLSGSKAGCKGGDGGAGGDGGPGSGGRGGHAIGIAFAKTPSAAPAIVTFTGGTIGGAGGAPGAASGNSGEQGRAGQCWDFAKGKVCGT
jgi:hypothetical protein